MVTEAVVQESPAEATPKRIRLRKVVHEESPTEQIQDVIFQIQQGFKAPTKVADLGTEVVLDDKEEELEIGEEEKDAQGTHPSPLPVLPTFLGTLF